MPSPVEPGRSNHRPHPLVASAATILLAVLDGYPGTSAQVIEPSSATCLTELIPFPSDLKRGFIFSLPDGSTCSPTVHFVDTSRGSLRFQWVDLILPGSLPFPITRVYDGMRALEKGPGQADFGPGWSLGFEEIVMVPQGSDEMVLYSDETIPIRFMREPGEFYRPVGPLMESGWTRLMVLPDGSLEAVDAAGVHHLFTASGQPGRYLLAHIEDAQGHRVRFVRRTGLLERIETERGDFVEFLRDESPLSPRFLKSPPPGR